jgi:3-dehydroquinate dehydratase
MEVRGSSLPVFSWKCFFNRSICTRIYMLQEPAISSLGNIEQEEYSMTELQQLLQDAKAQLQNATTAAAAAESGKAAAETKVLSLLAELQKQHVGGGASQQMAGYAQCTAPMGW